MKVFALIGILLLTVAVGGAYAQQADTSRSHMQSNTQNQVLMNSDKVKGSEVMNNKGEKLGTVENVALDLMNGRISYVVIDPGIGKNYVPVPYKEFGVEKNGKLVLNIDKDKLDKAPGYGRSGHPDWANRSWDREVARYWGSEPVGTMAERGGGQMQPAPMGQESKTPMGKESKY